jgi:hypothetical protein
LAIHSDSDPQPHLRVSNVGFRGSRFRVKGTGFSI